MITVRNLSIGFGDEPLFENANIKIEKNDKLALVGRNGSGKTTLLRIIAGLEEPDSGDIFKRNGISIGYLPQEFTELSGGSIFDTVKNSLKEFTEIEKTEREISAKLNEGNLNKSDREKLLAEYGELQNKKERIDFYSIDARIKKTLLGLGFAEKDFSRNVAEFSGGWKMRVHLAKIILAEPDLIMLDEPTNHLDLFSLRWLADFLENYKKALLIVSHDKYFIERVTRKTVEIANGKIILFNGKFSAYMKYKEQRDAELKAQLKNKEKRVKEIERFIERFRYKATKAKQVQSRIKYLEKLEKISVEEAEKEINIRFNAPPRLPAVPLEVRGLFKAYGELSVLENVSFKLEREDKIAFVGINGAGKSTLAKILAGKLNYDKGEVLLHEMTRIAYFSQETADNLDLEKDALDTLMSEPHDYTLSQIRGILGAFLFSDDDVFKKVSVLSGGEKARLALAKLLLKKANLLILDEPTNHLDYASKTVLQKALTEYQGSVILISHDIDFMRPFINKVLEFKNRTVTTFYGGIDYYLEKSDFEQGGEIARRETKEKTRGRKEQKRIEAELRKRKYEATKDLKAKIEVLEKKIAELEEQSEKLQNDMTKEEVYSDPIKMKETQKNFRDAKEELEIAYEEWTKFSEELEETEKRFDRELNRGN